MGIKKRTETKFKQKEKRRKRRLRLSKKGKSPEEHFYNGVYVAKPLN